MRPPHETGTGGCKAGQEEQGGDDGKQRESLDSVDFIQLCANGNSIPHAGQCFGGCIGGGQSKGFIFLNPVLYMGTQFLADGRAQGLVGNLIGYFIQESFLIQKEHLPSPG